MKNFTLLFVLMGLINSQLFAQVDDISKLENELKLKTDTARVNILNKLSILYASSDLRHADSLANEASQLLENLDYSNGEITNLNYHSYIESSQGKYDVAAEYSEKAVQLSIQIDDKKLLAESYNYLFSLYFQKGENIKALPTAEKALKFAEEADAKSQIAKANDNLGIMQGIKGQHTEAIEYFMKSLQYYEALGDEPNIGLTLMHIGHTFELAGNNKEALKYLKRSLRINKKVGNKYNEAWCLINSGVVYDRLKKPDTALIHYKKALAIAEQINNQRLILTCLDNIGGRYSLKGDFKKANQYLQRAYQLSEASGKNSRTVYITGNLAENYLYMGQFDSARMYGEQQLELALESDLFTEQNVAYYNLAQIYDSLHQYEKAYKSLLEYIVVNDTIFSREKSQQIEALRESYEAEQKEQEISNLKTVNENVRLRNRAYTAISIAIFILGGFLFYIQRLRVKRNRALLEKEQEVDRMKSQFFSNISHEFRTPLTLILGPLSDMLSKSQDPSSTKHLTVIKKNADRLLGLINQLLDLSKIESGKMKLQTTKSDIISVLKGVTLSFHSIMEQKEIDLDLQISPDKLEINFDRAKFETILTNLLSNAFKFTPQKGRITVESKITKNKVKRSYREFIEVSITDTGVGIPEKDVANIFNRFYQSDGNQLLQQEGSGIGLALSKELVELHEGNIYASSKEGKGTQIVFDIPTDIPEDETSTDALALPKQQITAEIPGLEESPEIELEEETTLSVIKPAVLVVEDHPEVQQYICEILKDKYTVATAKDGEEGIMKATDAIPDLIISDIMMPRIDGFEVSRTLKSDEKTSHIPIILLTAKAASEEKIEGLKTKADDYITKPFVPDELLIRVENLIESRKKLRAKYKKQGALKPADIAENSIDEKFLSKLIEMVENNMANEQFGVEKLGESIGMSRSQLNRKLRALLDQSTNQFIQSYRLNRAHDLLMQKAATASEVAYQVGFSSPSYFTKCFHEQFGYVPTDTHKYQASL